MSNQLATIKRQIEVMKPEFGKALPGHISADRFVRTVQTAISITRNIDRVSDLTSLYAACTKAAADGLILDGREAALVIDYKGAAQYRPMMRGLLKLAYQSGLISSISVQVAYARDVFEYVLGDDERIIHRPHFGEGGRGDPVAVYAIAKLKDGSVIREVMSVDQVNRIRERSDGWKAFKAQKIKDTPWATDWEEMARKTVFRRLTKYLPSSTDIGERMHSAVERIDEDYTFNAEPQQPAGGVEVKQAGAAAAILKDVTPAPQPKEQPSISKGDDYDRETGEIIDVDPQFEEQAPPPPAAQQQPISVDPF